MFQQRDDRGYVHALAGIQRKTLVHGEKTLMTEFRLEMGAVLPEHAHPNEQTGYLISGCLDLTIGNETQRVLPGGSWCIPAGESHHARAQEDSIAIEVFAPLREDYL